MTYQSTATPGAGPPSTPATPTPTANATLTDQWLSKSWRATWLGLGAVAAIVVVVVLIWHHPLDPAARAVIGATVLTYAAIVILGFAVGPEKGGTTAFVLGFDNRLSTSKLQVALWTIAIVYAFLFFIVQILCGAKLSGVFDHLDGTYLLLLGGPFASAVVAKATTSSQDTNGNLQQTTAATPSAADLVTGHDDAPSVTDAQYFLFNLVALAFFAVSLAKNPSTLPKLPDTLAALTSVSALTYLGAKAVSGSSPSITSVTLTPAPGHAPDGKARAGDTVNVYGANFAPRGTPQGPPLTIPRVVLNGIEMAVDSTFTDSSLAFTFPAGAPSGQVTLQVSDPSNVTSDVNTSLQAA